MVLDAELSAGGTGHVSESVDALVDGLGAAEGSLAASLAALARATARQVDQGQPGAVSQLRHVLAALDQAAQLTHRSEALYSPFDVWCALTPRGVRRKSEVGLALVAWMESHHMSMGKLGPFDRPWACPSCGFQADRDSRRQSRSQNGDDE